MRDLGDGLNEEDGFDFSNAKDIKVAKLDFEVREEKFKMLFESVVQRINDERQALLYRKNHLKALNDELDDLEKENIALQYRISGY